MNEIETINTLLYKMNNYKITKDEYRYLQYLLLKNEPIYRQNYPISKLQLDGSPIMIISDTHFGGTDENKQLLITAYNTALKKNIKITIHAGDLIEACANNQFNKPPETIIEEIKTSINNMRVEILTYLLIGNHDYSAIRTYPNLLPYFFNYANLEILGLKKAHIKYSDSLISINHKISQISNTVENTQETLELHGHFHRFSIDENKNSIYLPPLCKDTNDLIKEQLKKYGITLRLNYNPSFLILSKTNWDTILLEFHIIDKDTNCLETNTKKLEINTNTRKITKYKN